MDLIQTYKTYCESKGIPFQLYDTVTPCDETTLFCPAGMQRYKKEFKNKEIRGTLANIQSCIRMNDFEELGDATHLLYFNMIGLFSFRTMSIQEAIDFWIEFLTHKLDLAIDYVTIHPDKLEWKSFYSKYGIKVVLSDDCKWTDGDIGGYCTEFFKDDIEIGNIVNPNGDCIDVGFGLERLEMFVNKKTFTKEQILVETIQKIIDSGYYPSNVKQGYVLRKLLRELVKIGGTMEHKYFALEKQRQEKLTHAYHKLKRRYPDKPKEWWYDTHGIDIDSDLVF